MAALTLKIITPERIVLDTEVDEVTARAIDGEVTILANHEPLLTALDIDVLRYRKGKEEDSAAVIGGVLEVQDNTVTVLSDVAELETEIDEARAKDAKARAEAEKTQKAQGVDVYVHEMALSRAIARLKAAELGKLRKKRNL